MKNLLTASLAEPFFSVGLLILRVGTGLALLLGHGIGKLQNIGGFTEGVRLKVSAGGATALAWCAVLAEVVGAVLLVLGFATRLALIPPIIVMAVAICIVHQDDPWKVMEPAALYLTAFLALICTGPGKFSLDAALAKPATAADQGDAAGTREN